MRYPCIVYHDEGLRTLHADDIRYFNKVRYTLTVIDEVEDSQIPGILIEDKRLKYLSMDRSFVSDGMYHFVFTLYF